MTSIFSPSQIVCLQSYAEGEFSWLIESVDKDIYEHCGDGLLTFLLNELAVSEDCFDMHTAVARVEAVLRDVGGVHAALIHLTEEQHDRP